MLPRDTFALFVGVRVELQQTSLSLSEDAGTVSVCANLILVGNTKDLAIPVSADAVVVNGTAFGKEKP